MPRLPSSTFKFEPLTTASSAHGAGNPGAIVVLAVLNCGRVSQTVYSPAVPRCQTSWCSYLNVKSRLSVGSHVATMRAALFSFTPCGTLPMIDV